MREFQACRTKSKVARSIHLYDLDLFSCVDMSGGTVRTRCGRTATTNEAGDINRSQLCSHCTAFVVERLEARDIGVRTLNEILSQRQQRTALAHLPGPAGTRG